MSNLIALLESQPLLSLFLVIGLGYAVGEITLRGFSLGVGAVLFVGLLIGWLAPKAAPPPLIGSLGLVMFLYGTGIQYGRHFVRGLTGAEGRRWNLLAVTGLAAGTVMVLVLALLIDLPLTYLVGMFSGSMTSTAALQAAIDASGSTEPAVGYSVAYPFGVIGPIICMYLAQVLFRPKLEQPLSAGLAYREIAIRNPAIAGRTLGEVIAKLPSGLAVAAVRHQHHNRVPRPEMILGLDDVLLLAADDPGAVEQAQTLVGEPATMRILRDRIDLDYLRVFVSKRGVVGLPLADLRLPGGSEHAIVDVRRGDTEVLPRPDLVLEFGDRVGVIASRRSHQDIRRFFGDSIKGTTEFSYVSIGIGMVLGVALGLVPFPIPGLGTLKLGIAGGPLIVALILGWLGRTRGLVWSVPLSANLTLRNFGLTIFLAQVGMNSGPSFVATVQETGLYFLLISALLLLAVVLTTLALGWYLFRLPFDDLLGVTAGVTGNPAILAYASRAVPTERPDIGYAVIFPTATIIKILIVQGLLALGP
jgi:putative transport protein